MSYWCGQQLVVTLDGPSGRSELTLTQPFARVGSHPQADVVIDDESVAPRSLYLHAIDDGVFCLYLDVDANSASGKGIWLAPDSVIPLGAYRLQARLADAPASGASPTESLATWGSAPPPVPLVMIYCGRRLKDKRRFRARLSAIGRRPQCALQLKGEKVSGFHCVLFWEHEQLWCVDLNSSNGTQLNGSPLDCQRINIGDRLDVGEFGLVFLRLSNRPLVTDPGLPGGPSSADALDSRETQPVAAPLPYESPEERTVVTSPAEELALRSALPPSFAQTPEGDEDRRLREQLAEEVACLAKARDDMHRQWEQSSRQLLSQIGQLHEEAARLASERQAFEQSRQQWQLDQATIVDQLVKRSDHLARLEQELAAATASLADRLARLDQREQSPAAAPAEPRPSTPEELAQETEDRRLREQLTAQLAALSQERQQQTQWEQTSQQLLAQINNLQAQAAELATQRQDLDDSRHEWQAERAALEQQFHQRSDQLSRLESQLAAATKEYTERLAPVEKSSQQASLLPAGEAALPVAPAIEFPPAAALDQPAEDMLTLPPTPGTEESPSPGPHEWTSSPPDSSTRRDQLPLFVSDRLLELDRGRGRKWLWWSAGGVGVVAAIAVVVAIVVWVL